MSNVSAYIGQVILFAGKYVIEGWLPCDGRTLKIQEYQALYTVIETRYGGDGIKTFNLPDLRGAVPLGSGGRTGGTQYSTGDVGGNEQVSKNLQVPLPKHTHAVRFIPGPPQPVNPVKIAVNDSSSSGADNVHSPDNAFLAKAFTGATGTQIRAYTTNDPGPNAKPLAGVSGGSGGGITGGSVQIDPAGTDATGMTLNTDVRQPYVAMRYLICVEGGDGIYPPADPNLPQY